jgi:hypothetical protein
MIRLEQVRGEMLERFERVDRRFAQNEQRAGRIEQRLTELAERIDALRQALAPQLLLTDDEARVEYGRERESASGTRDGEPEASGRNESEPVAHRL